MTKVVLTAKVKDGKAWEKAYLTHGDMFRSAGLGQIDYTVKKNDVVMCTEVADVGAYMDFIASKETRKAMKHDGVKRKTVSVHVLDKAFSGQ